MRTITLYRSFSLLTFSLFFVALIVPVANIIVTPLNPGDSIYLEFICVYCQYGGTDASGSGTLSIQNLTPFSFYGTWILNVIFILLAMIPVAQGFPELDLKFITAKRAVYTSWILTIAGASMRGLLSLLLKLKVSEYEAKYPSNQVLGELSWSMGGVTIGAILSASTAMIGYILWLYDTDPNIKSAKVPYYKSNYGAEESRIGEN